MKFSTIFQSIRTRLFIAKNLLVFLWKNKLWWLIPLVVILVVFFVFMLFIQSSSLGPLIYPLI